MHNDTAETLLLRHYGPTAPRPEGLEHRLVHALHQEKVQEPALLPTRQARLMTRRQILRAMTFSTASAGLVGLALEGVQQLDTRFFGHDATTRPRAAY
jgi:hypothetical protein